VLQDRELSATDKLVLITIIQRVGSSDYWAIPHKQVTTQSGEVRQGIAELVGISESTAKRATRKLEQLGYIQKQRTPSWNRYSLTAKSDPNCQLENNSENPEIVSDRSPMTLSDRSPMTLTLTRNNELDSTNLVGEYASPERAGVEAQPVEVEAVADSLTFELLIVQFEQAMKTLLHSQSFSISNGSERVSGSLQALKKAYDWGHSVEYVTRQVRHYRDTHPNASKVRNWPNFVATNLGVILNESTPDIPATAEQLVESYCPACQKPKLAERDLCTPCLVATQEHASEAPQGTPEPYQPVSSEYIQEQIRNYFPQAERARKLNL
jgi:DNA-binding Lrp family transcriptional regulator